LKSAYKYTFYLDSLDEDDDIIVPEGLQLDTLLYLKHPLRLDNTRGINDDTRGTKFPKIEFGDFYSTWRWNRGFLTLRDLADGCFRLKSHKFENWYEMITGINGSIILTTTNDNLYMNGNIPAEKYYFARLWVDHGS
jgi:hypothetical protein